MASGTFTTNVSTSWFRVVSPNVHIGVAGTFDSGAIAVEKRVEGTTYALLDGGAAISLAAADDSDYLVGRGDEIRLTASGGGGSMSIDWNISGELAEFDV